jgi:hypothetical protein
LKQRFTRAYRPQTNGKAERFIQSALREWAYAFSYQHSTERTDTLEAWMHHYNWHRPHQGIGGATPISRLKTSRNNLLTLHRLAITVHQILGTPAWPQAAGEHDPLSGRARGGRSDNF